MIETKNEKAGRQAIFWLIVLGVIFTFFYFVRGILLPFVMAIGIAYFFDPLARRLERSGFKRWTSAALVLLFFAIVFAGSLFIVLPVLEHQVAQLIAAVPNWIKAVKTNVVPQVDQYLQHLGVGTDTTVGDMATDYGAKALSTAGTVLAGILTGGLAVLDLLSLLLITPVVAFYLLRDWNAVMVDLDNCLPREHEPTLRRLFREIDRTLSGFIRGQALVCLIQAIYYAVALSIAGLDFGALVGVATGILTFIPYLGAVIGLATGLLIAVAQWHDLPHTLIILGLFAFGQMMEGNFITPALVGDRIGLHPAWVIFAVLAGGALFGFPGILVAVPVAAVIGVLIRFAVAQYKTSHYYLGSSASPEI